MSKQRGQHIAAFLQKMAAFDYLRFLDNNGDLAFKDLKDLLAEIEQLEKEREPKVGGVTILTAYNGFCPFCGIAIPVDSVHVCNPTGSVRVYGKTTLTIPPPAKPYRLP